MQTVKEKDFKDKIIEVLEEIPFVIYIVALYFLLINFKAPFFSQIAATILYFVSPFDAIPDFITGTEYIDYASVIFALIEILRSYLTEDHYIKARDFINKLKGGKKY